MGRGIKKKLKRLNAPSHWMIDKLGGIFAPKPSAGPHNSRECLPLILILRNRLKYALTGQEVKAILLLRLIKIDGKVRTESSYPIGFQDVLEIERTSEQFRLMLDRKGRFMLHRINTAEASYKLCRIKRILLGNKGVPFAVTNDGRSIRYPGSDIKADDTVMFDLISQNIKEHVKFELSNLVIVTGGHNAGRVGLIIQIEKHPGSHSIIKIRDATGNDFATRKDNVFLLGKGNVSMVSLPNTKGLRHTIMQ